MKFDNHDEAYSGLANYLLAFIGQRSWDEATACIKVFASMAQGSQSLTYGGRLDTTGGFDQDPTAVWAGLDAAIFLRDNLLQTTGQRIWGLTFTLYPDGKFNIDFDYNKPEGYEESDDVITGDEINASLAELTGRKKPAP